MINLVLECIDRLHVYSSAAHFADVAGKEAGETWKSILNSLYELLGKILIWIKAFTGIKMLRTHLKILKILRVGIGPKRPIGHQRPPDHPTTIECSVHSHGMPALVLMAELCHWWFDPYSASMPLWVFYAWKWPHGKGFSTLCLLWKNAKEIDIYACFHKYGILYSLSSETCSCIAHMGQRLLK